MHALIIEDDGLVACYLDALLCELGYSCTCAATEAEAIEAARKECPDLISADLHLRSGDGRSAVRTIRERCPAAVVFVTGNPEELEGSVPEACVVAKPFTADGLVRAIAAARQGH